MDRFTLIYTDGVPSAIQDRHTAHQLTADELDTICELLNNYHNDIRDEQISYDRAVSKLEADIDTLTEQLNHLEDENARLENELDAALEDAVYLETQLRAVQSQEAAA